MQEQPSSQPQPLGETGQTPQQPSFAPQPGPMPYPTDTPMHASQMQPQPVYPQFPYPGSAPMYPSQVQPQQMYAQTPASPAPAPGYPGMPPANMTNTVVNVNVQQKGHGLLIRAIYFLCIGWWLGYFWLWLGFFLCGLIVTLPLGLAVLNRLPQVLTLRPAGASAQTNVAVSTTTIAAPAAMPGMMPGSMTMAQTVNVNVTVGGTRQTNFLVRALYFLFIGWWAGLIWANMGYFLCLLIITLPIGLMMLNRLPVVLTLRKN